MIKPWLHLVPGGNILYKAYLEEEDISLPRCNVKGMASDPCEHPSTPPFPEVCSRSLQASGLRGPVSSFLVVGAEYFNPNVHNF